jgi:putative hydrolase of the HAD superfamily
MTIKADSRSYFVFDLDDTLYSEIDFLKSAYRFIAFSLDPSESDILYQKMLKIYLSGSNAFKYVIEKYPEKQLSIENLLNLYRNHFPEISLRDGAFNLLTKIKKGNGKIGIITDGRSITQRNKIVALGIGNFIDKLIISEEFGHEKPAMKLFESFMVEKSRIHYFYFGDNLDKDFISSKKLGWTCIGIIDEKNIHKKYISELSNEYLPHIFVKKFSEIEIIYNEV